MQKEIASLLHAKHHNSCAVLSGSIALLFQILQLQDHENAVILLPLPQK